MNLPEIVAGLPAEAYQTQFIPAAPANDDDDVPADDAPADDADDVPADNDVPADGDVPAGDDAPAADTGAGSAIDGA